MNKNVYSLVLSENVVAEIDRLAYARHTNRSNLINRILAEYVSYTTPEMRTDSIFDALEAFASATAGFRPAERPSPTMLRMCSALEYKYNPTVRYSVEIYRHPGDSLGELKVSLRTQNSALMLYLVSFFRLWARIEQANRPAGESAVAEGKFIKELVFPENSIASGDAEALAGAINAYIKAFDAAMKAFFCCADTPSLAAEQVERIYREYRYGAEIPL
ncbi:MAG: hypothetical protein IK047_05575 [Clostridia bacterium]|nr:hypothetical protein [Clostridia bacterium]MBR5746618.1 hypothetical protein [Clostridia bacterium]